ncbi:MAG TPA: alpha/beta hydrolase [Propionibacteriaceae bacterium]|nr:alpha/beta hydrolase [Propionibacteriaceae bacterium]
MHHADRRLRFATTRLATGPQVHYAEQGDPDGEPVLFLPAYADSWFSYSRVLPLLPARSHAYALDQRGHGDSERPAGGYTVDDLAADAVAFLDAAGIERATLVGHSGSCLTARRMAVTDPDRVAGLVLIGAPLSLAKSAVLAFQAAVHALEDPVAAQFVRRFQAGAVHVPLPEEFLEGLVAESLKLPATVWKRALDGLVAFDDAADLDRITAPTLLIWGDQDAVVSREEQQRLEDAMPDARLKVYPDTGHSPHWERPEAVAADVDDSRDRSRPPDP